MPVRRPAHVRVAVPVGRHILHIALILRRLRLQRPVERLRRDRCVEHEISAYLKPLPQRLGRDHVPERVRHHDAGRRRTLNRLGVKLECIRGLERVAHVLMVVKSIEGPADKVVVPVPGDAVEARPGAGEPQALEDLVRPVPRGGLRHVEAVQEEDVLAVRLAVGHI